MDPGPCYDGIPVYTDSSVPFGLSKGLNLDFFGGGISALLYAQTWDPYNPARLQSTMQPADYAKLRAAGFDHVRLALDPFELGGRLTQGTATLTGEAAGSIDPYRQVGQYPDANGNYAVARNVMNALHLEIQEILDADLNVIIDCHPVILNQTAFNQTRAKFHNPDGSPTWGIWQTTYPGEFSLPFVIGPILNEGEEGLSGTFVQMNVHPLANFWGSLATYLAGYDTEKVFFEVMNEPLVNVTKGVIDPGSLMDENDWTTWRKAASAQWYKIQRAAVRRILEVDKKRKILVTTSSGLVPELATDRRANYDGFFIPAAQVPRLNLSDYTNSERNQLMVAVHLYEAFEFTHPPVSNQWGPTYGKYDVEKHFFNVVNDEWALGTKDSLSILGAFKIANNNPAIVITEFGSNRQETEPVNSVDGLGSVIISTRKDRQRWTFDVRRRFEEKLKVGWTYYSLRAQFGVAKGRMNLWANWPSYSGQYQGYSALPAIFSSTTGTGYIDDMHMGLYGFTRP